MAESERRPPAQPLTQAEQVGVLKADVARLATELEAARSERSVFAEMVLAKHGQPLSGDALQARDLASLPASQFVVMTVGGLRAFCLELAAEAERISHA